ncbi:hypothetical protein ACIHDR_48260 [Nocardia sp. NPDC052278]|uniref:hypothetical protein n=1 Tax=unclassified Nocardia TaxID=2637762 RepID=UPI00367F6FD6
MSTIESHGVLTGMGITSGGSLVPVVGATSAVQIQTTDLVAMTAPTPPLRRTTGLILVGVAFLAIFFVFVVPLGGLIIGSMAAQGGDHVVTSAVILFGPFILLWAVPFAMVIPRVRRNRRIARGRTTAMAAFQDSWYCGRCGGCFLSTTSWRPLPARTLMSPLEYRTRLWQAAGYA